MSHFSALSSHRHINAFMNKDSNCRFGYEILEEGLAYEEKTKERDYMKLFRTNDERYGYNVKDPFFRGH